MACYACPMALINHLKVSMAVQVHNEATKKGWDGGRPTKAVVLAGVKATTPCADCGGYFPACAMDFDHLPEFEKTFELAASKSAKFSWRSLIKEAAKCDLVCSNCHRIRTDARRLPEFKPKQSLGLLARSRVRRWGF